MANGELDDCVRITVMPPLPCGLAGCGRLTSLALAEPDPDHPGLWATLPICTICAARLEEAQPGGSTRERQELSAQ